MLEKDHTTIEIEHKKVDPFFKNQRAAAVQRSSHSTGIDYIDYIETQENTDGGWDLWVYFLQPEPAAEKEKSNKAVPPGNPGIPPIKPGNISIYCMGGGPANLAAQSVKIEQDKWRAIIHLEGLKDSGSGTAVPGPAEDHNDSRNIPGYFLEIEGVTRIDPFFSTAPFYLRKKEDTVTSTDPRTLSGREARERPVTEIDYLCKDYASFRRLILDHLNLLVPGWQERNAADPGMTLVEIMAYAGDYLSYHQDAAAAEAYPGTARRRISLRRHARLLDYFINQGCNSRVLVQVQVENVLELKKGTPLLTAIPGQPTVISPEYYGQNILYLDRRASVFETMSTSTLYPEHNRMKLYKWETSRFPRDSRKGIVRAELEGHFPHLEKGSLLFFKVEYPPKEESSRYHPVCLVCPPRFKTDPLTGASITIITWADEDALPYSMMEISEEEQQTCHITVLGNILLADSGRTISSETLPPVPDREAYYPYLDISGLVYAAPYHTHSTKPFLSVENILHQDANDALPSLELRELHQHFPGEINVPPARPIKWTPRRDLLNSGPFDQDFAVETEEDGGVYLRFGDGQFAKRPIPGTRFKAVYRITYSQAESIEPLTIAHVVTADSDHIISWVFNPQAATCSIRPETREWIRLAAPQAFKTQARCITAQDYVNAAEKCPGVEKAQARLDCSGNCYTASIYIDREEGKPLDEGFKDELKDFLEPYRPIGFKLEIFPPQYVPLYIKLAVYVYPGVLREMLLPELNAAFSNVCHPDGTCGFFYPGNFTFGQPIYVSGVVDRAMEVKGVRRVDVIKFQRWHGPHHSIEKPGKPYSMAIEIGPLEIARLDNKNGEPWNGTIEFDIKGGESNGKPR